MKDVFIYVYILFPFSHLYIYRKTSTILQHCSTSL